jgi:secreted Zn-dependent insulinase-like peptidase
LQERTFAISQSFSIRGKIMSRRTKLFLTVATLAFAAGARAQSNDFATGNMRFDAAAIDANGDHMISKDEFMQFGETMWSMMSKGAATIAVQDAAQDFARGNMKFSAKKMDADHDGTISKEEFMSYGAKKFDRMKDKSGMMTTADATKYFSRGNIHDSR